MEVLHIVPGIAEQKLKRVDARRRGLAERLEHGVRRVEARQAFDSAFELVLGFRERQRRGRRGPASSATVFAISRRSSSRVMVPSLIFDTIVLLSLLSCKQRLRQKETPLCDAC